MRLKTFVLTSLLPILFAINSSHADVDSVRRALSERLPNLNVDSIRATPIPSLYELVLSGQVYYLSEDARFVVQGQITDLNSQENITEKRRSQLRLAVINELDDDQTILFAPKGEVKHTVTVFTDIDCPYCQKLHQEVPKLNAEGVAVRYLLYPRAGIGSRSYHTAVSVWCSSDRNQALTDAKAGKSVDSKQCANPVKDHLAVGERVGLRGTPYMVSDGGTTIPGYQSARKLLATLSKE